MILYRPGTRADADWLGPRLRAADRAECWGMFGLDGREALRRGVDASVVLVTAEVGGEPAALFGVTPVSIVTGEGAPWMLASPAADRTARAWLSDAPGWLRLIGGGWTVLRNHVAADNRRAIRWLRWMGFELGAPAPFGASGMLCRSFEMRMREAMPCARQ